MYNLFYHSELSSNTTLQLNPQTHDLLGYLLPLIMKYAWYLYNNTINCKHLIVYV